MEVSLLVMRRIPTNEIKDPTILGFERRSTWHNDPMKSVKKDEVEESIV